MISDQRIEQALKYLAQTDAVYARHKAQVADLEERKKVVYAECLSDSVGDTASDRQHIAYTDDRYIHLIGELADERLKLETYRAKRETENTVLDIWRTQQATARGKQ